MSSGKGRIVGALIEEMIGLATMLIPEAKAERHELPPMESFSEDVTMGNIRAMKSLVQNLKESEAITCLKCKAHVDKIGEELEWLEQHVPTYERVAKLRRTLHELLEEIGPGIPGLPQEKPTEKPSEQAETQGL